MAIFIDLEKAFELASPNAILAAFVNKGIKGKLISWIKSFLEGRAARVRFQVKLSTPHSRTNGTPQGSVLSPLLFNVLMEGLLNINYGPGITLLCYADDLALVFSRRN